jgi:hypothetical protein
VRSSFNCYSSQLTISKARHYPLLLDDVVNKTNNPNLVVLTERFLFDQLFPDSSVPGTEIHPSQLPCITGNTFVYHSAITTFYAPSNYSGEGGMYRERIRANPLWKKGDIHAPRYDCVLIKYDPNLKGFPGLRVACL